MVYIMVCCIIIVIERFEFSVIQAFTEYFVVSVKRYTFKVLSSSLRVHGAKRGR